MYRLSLQTANFAEGFVRILSFVTMRTIFSIKSATFAAFAAFARISTLPIPSPPASSPHVNKKCLLLLQIYLEKQQTYLYYNESSSVLVEI